MRKELTHRSGFCFSMLFAFVLLFCCSSAGYANYALDTGFGNNGTTRTDFITSGDDCGYSLAIDSDGRYVVAGTSGSSFALARYTKDGTLDTSFGNDGKTTTVFKSGSTDYGYSLAIDSDERNVVAGCSKNGSDFDFALARYTKDGILDTSFGTNGTMTTGFGLGTDDRVYSLAIDSDGRYVVAGYSKNGSNSDFALARYTKDGALDTSFGTNGTITTSFGSDSENCVYSLTIDSEGRHVVAGYSFNNHDFAFALARYTKDGILDTSFGKDGKTTTVFGPSTTYGLSLAIDSQERLVLAGFSGSAFALARYTKDGILDTSFGENGKTTTGFGSSTNYGHSLAIDSRGRLVVAGESKNGSVNAIAIVRYKTDGKLDVSFGKNGIITTSFGLGNDDCGRSLVIDGDDRLILAGESHNNTNYSFALARYKEEDGESSGGCNIPSIPALGFLFAIPIVFLSKKRK